MPEESTLPPPPSGEASPTPVLATAPAWRKWARGSLIAPLVLIALGYGIGNAAARGGYVPGPKDLTAEAFRGQVQEKIDQPPLRSLRRIYARNFLTLVILCLGIGSAGIVTGLQILFIGGGVGANVAHLLRAGVDGRVVFWFLFPHGVPEILSFCLAGSVGLHGLAALLRYLRGGPLVEPGEVGMLLRRSVVAIVLLVVAGLVEVFITPAVGRRFL